VQVATQSTSTPIPFQMKMEVHNTNDIDNVNDSDNVNDIDNVLGNDISIVQLSTTIAVGYY